MKNSGFTHIRHSADSRCESSRILDDGKRSCLLTKARSRMTGFTLIELSIVLVIIGLVAGGVLVGVDLKKAAERRSIITQLNQYQTAIMAFKGKYGKIPGDIPNATTFFSGVSNGNDSKIFDIVEVHQFWLHLAKAGLIEGSYTGVTGPDQTHWDVVLGVNAPKSKMSGVGFSVIGLVYDDANFGAPALHGNIPGTYGYRENQIQIGKEMGDYWTAEAFLTPTELWNIDTKIDNGKPGTGILVANSYAGCIDAGDQFAAATNVPDYNLASDEITCSIIIRARGAGL